MKRGGRTQPKSFCYLNLKHRMTNSSFSHPNISTVQWNVEDLRAIPLPDLWTTIVISNEKVTFFRHESWAFRNQRVITELTATKTDSDDVQYTVSSHGCSIDANIFIDNGCPKNTTVINKIKTIVELLERSNMCIGVSVPENEVIAMVDHQIGEFQELSTQSIEVSKHEVRAFSSCCSLLCHDKSCSNCLSLGHVDVRRKKRKREVITIHSSTNKRYLSKDELTNQLHEEKRTRVNAESRAKYWVDKFHAELLLIDDDDHNDLSKIMNDIEQKDIPENMACLWEQQTKLAHTKKNGYRRHPKLVLIYMTN